MLVEVGTLRGDTNVNGKVQFADFIILSNNFGGPGKWTKGDFDANGLVQFPDFLSLSANFGESVRSRSTASVPEPFSPAPATAGWHGCEVRSGAALKNGAANLSCGVRIAANQVPKRGSINRGMRDWGPFHSASKRAEMSAWTRAQPYCQG